MAICASCGKEIRDDVWACGSCGAPVTHAEPDDTAGEQGSAYGAEGYSPYASQAAASAGMGAYGAATTSYGSAAEGMTPYGTPLPQAAPASSGGLSQVTKLALAGAVVAIVAIVAVWFFVVRGSGGGDQFLGTWNAVKNGEGGLVIERGDDGLQVSMVGTDQERVGPLKTELSGGDLEIKLEAAGGDEADKAAVDIVRALFEASIEDFKLTLRVRTADGHLLMTVSGKAKTGGSEATVPVTEFVKAGTQAI
jgi:hypothetical protein